MDIVLESVFNSIDFSDTLFDMMVDDIFVDSAMEIGFLTDDVPTGQTSTPKTEAPKTKTQSTQQPKPASTQQNSSQNTQQQQNNTENKDGENKKDGENTKKTAPGLWDKLKAAIQWLIDTISNIIYNIFKRVTIIQRTGKNFEAEIRRLEKKYSPRTDIKLDMYKFDLKVLDTFLECTNDQYTKHKERVTKIMNDYEKVLHNNMTDEDFIDKNADLKNFSTYRGTYAEEFNKRIGMQGTSIDSAKEIMKTVREKFKGNASAVDINAGIYSKCRQDIRDYNTKIQNVTKKINEMKTESEQIKRKLQLYARNATANARSAESFSTCFRNCIKYFEEPINNYLFYVTNYNEYIVNCRLVVKKCLGG